MKKQANILYILCISAICITSAPSCNVLDLEQLSSIPYDEAFGTYQRCELSTLGCYAYAQGEYRGFPFGSRSTAINDIRGEDVMSSTYMGSSYEATFTTSSGDLSNHWSYLFRLVNQTNIVVDGVQNACDEGIISQEEADAFAAEARFLRALALHEAVVLYARPYDYTADHSHYGVPVVTVPCNTIEAVNEAMKSGRATVAETYEQILDDLTFAEEHLPETGSISRATKGAAIAIKSRVYMHMGDWNNVIAECRKMVDQASPSSPSLIGGFRLTESCDGPFLSNSENTESIFSIENSSADNPTLDGALSQLYYGRKDIAVSPIIYNAEFWNPADLRRSLLLELVDGRYFTKKYPRDVDMDDWAPMIRWAEVLLNYAEAEARVNGNTPLALELLNLVRNRAVTDPAGQYTAASFPSVEELINAILQERRIEFLAEGRRWYDIHRLSTDPVYCVRISTGEAGIPAKLALSSVTEEDYQAASGTVRAELYTVPEIPASDRRFIYPIPQNEINANPTLADQQNEGW